MSYLNNYQYKNRVANPKPPNKNTPIEKVLKFIEIHIHEFISDVKKKQKENELNEDDITEILCDVMNFYNHPLFWFHFQKIEKQEKGHNKSIDIGVKTRKNIVIEAKTFSTKNTFFALEAKRLKTKSNLREKEYVIGHFEKRKGKNIYKESGGIERFKTGSHGNKLNFAGMLGYVQEENFEYWQTKINNWIEELIKSKPQTWKVIDRLNKIDISDKIAKYSSLHKRTKNFSEIKLYHFWINLK